jgi:hypothetical protein
MANKIKRIPVTRDSYKKGSTSLPSKTTETKGQGHIGLK